MECYSEIMRWCRKRGVRREECSRLGFSARLCNLSQPHYRGGMRGHNYYLAARGFSGAGAEI